MRRCLRCGLSDRVTDPRSFRESFGICRSDHAGPFYDSHSQPTENAPGFAHSEAYRGRVHHSVPFAHAQLRRDRRTFACGRLRRCRTRCFTYPALAQDSHWRRPASQPRAGESAPPALSGGAQSSSTEVLPPCRVLHSGARAAREGNADANVRNVGRGLSRSDFYKIRSRLSEGKGDRCDSIARNRGPFPFFNERAGVHDPMRAAPETRMFENDAGVARGEIS